jgi:hypothetical protein
MISFLSCCYYSRKKQQKLIPHQVNIDPTTFYIHVGIGALTVIHSTHLIIADYGSSYGRHAIQLMKIIIKYLKDTHQYHQMPIFIHNDLPSNNWNQLFQLLMNHHSYPSLASGRSFYEQCLPSNCLSFGFSSASLHYLSRLPCCIYKHCYIRYAHDHERQQFQNQSKSDFNCFIQTRSKELLHGGILVLSIPSQLNDNKQGFEFYLDLLYQCAQKSLLLSSQELVDFNIPIYLRSFTECIDEELFVRCSLKLIKKELICFKSSIVEEYRLGFIDREQLASSLTILLQTSSESALHRALQINGRTAQEIKEISQQLWTLLENQIRDEFHHDVIHTYATHLILKKE